MTEEASWLAEDLKNWGVKVKITAHYWSEDFNLTQSRMTDRFKAARIKAILSGADPAKIGLWKLECRKGMSLIFTELKSVPPYDIRCNCGENSYLIKYGVSEDEELMRADFEERRTKEEADAGR